MTLTEETLNVLAVLNTAEADSYASVEEYAESLEEWFTDPNNEDVTDEFKAMDFTQVDWLRCAMCMWHKPYRFSTSWPRKMKTK